jgi:hypothetical protein
MGQGCLDLSQSLLVIYRIKWVAWCWYSALVAAQLSLVDAGQGLSG